MKHPVGSRRFYRNEALGLSGWGVVVEPADEIDAESLPVLVPWFGTLHGPVDGAQAAFERLFPGCFVVPGEGYRMLPGCLLWESESDAG